MKNVLIVFGSMTPEHDLSCRSAATILEAIDREKYNPVVVGITSDGQWIYTEATTEEIKSATDWEQSPTNRKALLDLNHGSKQLLVFEEDGTIDCKKVDVAFARIAGNTGEDGKLQGVFECRMRCYVFRMLHGQDGFLSVRGQHRPQTSPDTDRHERCL